MVLATVAALSGLGGAVGLGFFLLGLGGASATAALYGVVTGARDSLRDHPVGRGRVLATVVTGVVSFFLLVLSLAALAAS